MKEFWRFARQMLHYRRLLIIGGMAALFDAMCAFSGFGIVMLLLDQIFGKGKNMRQIVEEKLADSQVVGLIGDRTEWAQLIPANQFHGLAMVLVVVVSFVVLGAAMRFLYQAAALTIVLRTIMRIRKVAFQRLIHASYELLQAEGTADILSRISRDSHLLSRGFNALLGRTVRDVLMLTVFLSLAFISHWKLTLTFLFVAPLILTCLRIFGRKIRKASRRAMRAYGWMLSALQESTKAMAVVKVHNAEGYERRRFNTINRQVLKQEMKARIIRAISSPVIDLISIVGICIVCLVMGWMVYGPVGVEPPALLKVGMMLAAAGAAMRPLATLNNTLNESAAAAIRIDEVLQLPVEANTRQRDAFARPALARHRQSVCFENIAYAYPNAHRDAIQQVNFEVQFGQSVAIVGPNGSGKSTLLNLLPRLIDPKQGRITIDGIDIAAGSLRSLRKQMAMVTQQTALFEGTIADNIAYGRRHSGLSQIETAARAAYAHEFIEPLPLGYHTELGEMGTGLSGGQQQRICIARAILRDPAILILDEATSQIDADSEAKINQALRALRRGRTTFIIAHRLSTVIDSELIIVMNDGHIIDMGQHDNLLQRCDVYQTLTRTQLGDGRAA